MSITGLLLKKVWTTSGLSIFFSEWEKYLDRKTSLSFLGVVKLSLSFLGVVKLSPSIIVRLDIDNNFNMAISNFFGDFI